MKIILYKRNNFIGSSGGAERVLCNFANHFAARGCEMLLVTQDKHEGLPFYPLDERVRLVNLKPKMPVFGFVRRAVNKFLMAVPGGEKLLRKYKNFNREKLTAEVIKEFFNREKPDVVIAAGVPELADMVYAQKYDFPFIMMMHSLPSVYYDCAEKRKLKLLLAATEKAAAVQVLLPSYVEVMRPYYGGRTVVIGNAVTLPAQKAVHRDDKKEFTIIYMARFDRNKRQDLLIEAFARLAARFPQWKVDLWGQGRQREKNKIAALIAQHNLEKQVHMRGVTDETESELLKADICAFPSEFEGFPLSLSEAMAAGLPSVGMKTASGVNELIVDKKNGFLVDKTPEAFAVALEKLMSDAELREKMGECARKMISAYQPEVIWQQWEKLLNETVRPGNE